MTLVAILGTPETDYLGLLDRIVILKKNSDYYY
jgi:hypothetical protein